MKLRKLNTDGVKKFEEFITKAREHPEQKLKTPHSLLTDSEYSEEIEGAPELEPIIDTNIYQFARYLNEVFSPLDIEIVEGENGRGDRGFWSAVSLFYFDSLIRSHGKGKNTILSVNCYIPEKFGTVGAEMRYYRHRILGPYRLYKLHGELSEPFLLPKIGIQSSLYAKITDVLRLTEMRCLIEVIGILYFDAKKKRLKPDWDKKDTPGNFYRLLAIIDQFDLTYDILGINGKLLLKLLPKEFNAWKVQGDIVDEIQSVTDTTEKRATQVCRSRIFKGVHFLKGKYTAYVRHKGESFFLGDFETEAEANNVCDEKIIELKAPARGEPKNLEQYARTEETSKAYDDFVSKIHDEKVNTDVKNGAKQKTEKRYIGVSLQKGKYFSSRIVYDGECHNLGCFHDAETAARVRDKAYVRHYGKENVSPTKLNFPDEIDTIEDFEPESKHTLYSNNNTGYRGVIFVKKSGTYRAQSFDPDLGKPRYIKQCDSIIEAAKAYDKYVFDKYGKNAVLNFPEDYTTTLCIEKPS